MAESQGSVIMDKEESGFGEELAFFTSIRCAFYYSYIFENKNHTKMLPLNIMQYTLYACKIPSLLPTKG